MNIVWLTFGIILNGLGQSDGSPMDRVSLEQLLAATNGQAVDFDGSDVRVTGVTIDSRTVRPGEVFWAVRGDRQDGHRFAAEALRRGAAAAVIQKDKANTVPGPKILVPETLTALWDFAAWYRTTQDALMIGITGSMGKTTTREMIYAVLAARFPGTRSRQNYNNQFGVPLSILDIETPHEFAVLELAASRVGEIRDLAGMAGPEVGVVTGIAPAHLDGFGTEEDIVRAKGELVEALPPSGFAVLAGDDRQVRRMAGKARCRVMFIGEGTDSTLRARSVQTTGERISFVVDGDRYEIPCAGRHHVAAALAGIAVGREIGMTAGEIAEGLRHFRPAPGRCSVERIGPWTVIDDTYNANPRSMQAACDLLRDYAARGDRILVVGDMLELGTQSDAWHRRLGERAAAAGCDYILAHGRQASQVIRGALRAGMAPHRLALCEPFELVPALLDCWLHPGAVVLVKGSRGMQMERVVDWLRKTNEETDIQEDTSRAPARACA